MNLVYSIFFVVSLALATMRIDGVVCDVFKDVAHMWDGVLIGGAIFAKDKIFGAMALVITTVELLVFLKTHGML